ncbi:MAG: hypothetical protein WBZ20_09850, partial [Nitrososphaeraceae archaeon]
MKQRIKEIVLEEDRPFSFVDFRRFELNGEAYEMKHDAFRNNIVALKKAGEVELAFISGIAFYTIPGKKFKSMTADHMGGTTTIINESLNNNNTPLENSKSAPLALSTQSCCRNRYTSSEQITALAVGVYKKKCARGITYQDCLENGFAYHKRQAQDTLKYHLRIGTLFTLEDKRPQQYYPTAIRAEVIENKQKNTSIDPIGVALPNLPHISKGPLANCMESVIMQTLEGYVLPLLPEASLFIHNMHFKTKVS